MLRSELWERIQLCPAFGLKYVEVSCRTNHEVARMERMLLLGLRQLPSLAQIREGQAGGAKGKKGKRKQVAQDKAQELLAAVGLAGVGAFFASLGGETAAGINVRKGRVTNILEENVLVPLLVHTSAISLATECVRLILKIDDIVVTR